MKHLLILLITLCSLSVFAQSATPRTGVGVFHDNTFRAMTIKYIPVTYTGSTDTVNLNLNAYKTLVSIPALTGTVSVFFPSVSNCYLGDEVTFVAEGSGSVSFSGVNVAYSTPGMPLGVTARASITFIFDGVTWLEEHRAVQ